jgi:hypothetical protein
MTYDEGMSTRAENVRGELFLHYKGGRYRRLLQATLVPSTHWTSTSPGTGYVSAPIMTVLHSDDARPLRLVMTSGGPVVIDDRPGTVLGSDGDEISYDPFEERGPMTVYVSLTYGTIWGRARPEFDGVLPNGTPRFRPVSE